MTCPYTLGSSEGNFQIEALGCSWRVHGRNHSPHVLLADEQGDCLTLVLRLASSFRSGIN